MVRILIGEWEIWRSIACCVGLYKTGKVVIVGAPVMCRECLHRTFVFYIKEEVGGVKQPDPWLAFSGNPTLLSV